MITWIQLWPLLGLPAFMLSAIAAFPTFEHKTRFVGGGPIREWFLNHIAVPILPTNAAGELVAWFASASTLQEWILTSVIALNLNAALLPLLFGFGTGLIRLNNWMSTTDLRLKQSAARR